MIGQGYDGASAMSGEFKGVQSEIRRECPSASYVHCSSHCLNLSLAKGSIVQAIRNTVGTMSEVITFINASAKDSTVSWRKLRMLPMLVVESDQWQCQPLRLPSRKETPSAATDPIPGRMNK